MSPLIYALLFYLHRLIILMVFFRFCFVKNVPTGKWECPNCCPGSEPPEKIAHRDTISKRARTKIRIGKSIIANKSSDSNKKSRILGSSFFGKKRTSNKEKFSSFPKGVEKKFDCSNDLSCSNKPSHPFRDGSVEASSSFASVDDGKKPEISVAETPAEIKSGSSAKKVLTSFKIVNLKINRGASEKKQDLSCNERLLGDGSVLALEAANLKSRKRNRKFNIIDSRKKHRTDKERSAADVSKKRGSQANSTCPGTSKLRVKHAPVSLLDENAKTNIDVEMKDEVWMMDPWFSYFSFGAYSYLNTSLVDLTFFVLLEIDVR